MTIPRPGPGLDLEMLVLSEGVIFLPIRRVSLEVAEWQKAHTVGLEGLSVVLLYYIF